MTGFARITFIDGRVFEFFDKVSDINALSSEEYDDGGLAGLL
jgi:hypothetical protein